MKVIPNSKNNSIEAFQDNILKIRIKAPPDKGRANEELIEFLAKELNLPKSQIEIISGHTSRLKTLSIQSTSETLMWT